MENAKIGMLVVSVVLNLLLFSEVRKQSGMNTASLNAITTRLDLQTKAGETPGSVSNVNVSDKALIDLVNTTVNSEIQRATTTPQGGLSPTDKLRMDQLQERIAALQTKIDERGNAGQEKEKRLKEEATKLKQDILAQCVKR